MGRGAQTLKIAPTVEASVADVVREYNFYSSVDVDYDFTREGEHSESCSFGVCRCGVIQDPKVVFIPSSTEMARDIISRHQSLTRGRPEMQKIMTLYSLDRALALAHMDSDSFEIYTTKGYYGEEIDEVRLVDHTTVTRALKNAARTTSPTALVKSLLKSEYGHLLPEIQNARFQAKKVRVSDLHFGSPNHVQQDLVDSYSCVAKNKSWMSKLPQGVVTEKKGALRVIDGYHRLQAASGESVWVWKAV